MKRLYIYVLMQKMEKYERNKTHNMHNFQYRVCERENFIEKTQWMWIELLT